MKNHYRRIDVPNYSLPEFVEQAVESRNDADAIQARAILLDPWKKKIYDRSLFATSRIAQARYQLGLLETPHWTYADYRDFYEKSNLASEPPKVSWFVRFLRWRGYWASVVKTSAVVLLYMFLLNMCR